MKLMTNVALNEDQFRKLVSGGIVETSGVRIILSDIGWHKMLMAIEDAIREQRDRALERDQL